MGLSFLHLLHRYSKVDAFGGINCLPSKRTAGRIPPVLAGFVFIVVPFYVPVFGKNWQSGVFGVAWSLRLPKSIRECDFLLVHRPRNRLPLSDFGPRSS